jgi:hypothetical protein
MAFAGIRVVEFGKFIHGQSNVGVPTTMSLAIVTI